MPRHVHLCQSNQGAIYTWARDAADRITRRPYRCLSWRHEGPCARREAAVTFARIAEAFDREGFAPDGWVFLVLTLDRDGYYSGKPWRDVQTAFRELSRMSRNFIARVKRLCAKRGWRGPGRDWVATVEAHKSGWPHLNLVMYCPELAAELDAEREAKLAAGLTKRAAILLDGELKRCAVEPFKSRSGKSELAWGVQSTAERARSREALAGYIVKLAGQIEATSGELAKLTQVPTNAYERFRRLRSGKQFLLPRRRDPNITGTMMRRELDPQRCAFGAMPLHKVKDPEIARRIPVLAEFEEQRMAREAAAKRAALDLGLPYAQIAPPVVETFRFRTVGENFEVVGERITIDGERGYGEDAEGFLTWSPPRDDDPFDEAPDG